jgi:predicted transposase YbfD/YdcC
MARYSAAFAEIEDPRAENARHALSEILFIALAAVICGAESCADMALFGRAKERFLRQFLELAHGVPSHDTFSRVFRALDPEAFASVLEHFASAFAKAARKSGLGVVAVDGKACRRAYDAGKAHAPALSVSAFGAQMRMALALAPAPDGAEADAAMAVVRLLDLAGAIVTADALHCHRHMAETILTRGGDYLLALKGNRPTLKADAEARLALVKGRSASVASLAHGRRERRTAQVVSAGNIGENHDFPGLRTIVRIIRERDGESAARLYLCSRPLGPKQALDIARAHWDIENGLHWALDVVFAEDKSRARKDNAPHNLAILRRLSLNAVRSQNDDISLRGRVKRAGWDDKYLLKLLAQMR